MANVGLPGTSGFVGEFLTLVGAFRANPTVAFFATTGVILSAAYALWLYRARHLRAAREAEPARASPTSTAREIAMLAPLVILMIYYGVQPGPDPRRLRGLDRCADQGYQAALSLHQDCRSARFTEVRDEPDRHRPRLRLRAAGDHPRGRRPRAHPVRRLRGERSASLVTIGALALLVVALVAVLMLPAPAAPSLSGGSLSWTPSRDS